MNFEGLRYRLIYPVPKLEPLVPLFLLVYKICTGTGLKQPARRELKKPIFSSILAFQDISFSKVQTFPVSYTVAIVVGGGISFSFLF